MSFSKEDACMRRNPLLGAISLVLLAGPAVVDAATR